MRDGYKQCGECGVINRTSEPCEDCECENGIKGTVLIDERVKIRYKKMDQYK